MECINNYLYYFFFEDVPIFKRRLILILVIILCTMGCIILLPIIGIIIPIHGTCVNDNQFMKNILCYVWGFAIVIMLAGIIISLYLLLTMCRGMHDIIMANNSDVLQVNEMTHIPDP